MPSSRTFEERERRRRIACGGFPSSVSMERP
jgi:hypothetical protein